MMKKRNNYKLDFVKKEMDKRGQVAIFVIIAIVIVVAGILIYSFFPQILPFSFGEENPSSFLKGCIQPRIKESMNLLAKQGGYANPQGYIRYNNEKVKYLCYTSKYYEPCAIQQPMIKAQFENDLNAQIQAKADLCINDLKRSYESKGYVVDLKAGTTKVELVPDKVIVKIQTDMTVSKNDAVQNFKGFEIYIPSQMYNLLMIATSIIDFEATYGNTDTSLFNQYYPTINIYKNKLGDGSTIYGVKDVISQEKFTFASRSLAWPPGYGRVT
jgi:hypothetical protein